MPKSITKELKTDNTAINKVCPGTFFSNQVISQIEQSTRKANKLVDVVEKGLAKNLRLRWFQTRENDGVPVAFFALELAGRITNVLVPLDCGPS